MVLTAAPSRSGASASVEGFTKQQAASRKVAMATCRLIRQQGHICDPTVVPSSICVRVLYARVVIVMELFYWKRV